MEKIRRNMIRDTKHVLVVFLLVIYKLTAAQITAGTTTAGTNGGGSVFAPCTEILRFDGYNDAIVGSLNGQNFVFILGDGDSLFFNLKRTGDPARAVAAPGWVSSSFGRYGYIGLAGLPVIYQTRNGLNDDSKFFFSGITLKDNSGNTVQNFTMMVFDGESTGPWESITLTAPNPYIWKYYDSVAPPVAGYTEEIATGLGTNTVVWKGTYPDNVTIYNDWGISIHAPTSFQIALANDGTNPGLEAFVIGIDRRIAGLTIPVCTGGNIAINPTNAPFGTTYTWGTPVVNPAGSVTGATSQLTPADSIKQTLVYNGSGTSTVTYTITPNSCGLVDTPFTATVLFLASGSSLVISPGNDTTYCSSFSRTLSTSDSNTVWSTGDTAASIVVTTPGIYIASRTTSCGTRSDTVKIFQQQSPLVTLGNDTAYCGTFGRVLSTGVANTLWSTGTTAPQITVVSAGTYWAKVSNTCGASSDTITLTQNLLPNVFLGPDTSLCTGQNLLLNAANANLTYKWQDNSTNSTYNVTVAGNYSVTVTNNANCSATDTIRVSYVGLPPSFNIGTDTAYCGNFNRVISTGVVNTVWSTGITAAQITVTTPGLYWAKESNGCGATSDSITFTQNPIPIVDLGNDTALCSGQSLLPDATNPNSGYQWQDNSTNATYHVVTAGSYSVTVTTNAGCTASDAIQVSYSSPPQPFNIGNDTAYCGNFSRVITTGNSASIWSTGITASQITVTSPGAYWAIDTNHCGTFSDTITIAQNPIPVVALGNDTTLCSGQSLLLDATNLNSTYNWQNNSTATTFNVTSAGTYSVTVTNAFSCTSTDTILVNYDNQSPGFNLGNDTTYCSQFNRVLTTGVANTLWSTNAVSAQINVTGPGVYWAQATNACGTNTDTIVLSQSSSPQVAFTAPYSVCPGEMVTLQPVTSAGNFLWSNGQTSSSISITQPGSYTVDVWNNIACPNSATAGVIPGGAPVFSLGNDTSVCGGEGIILTPNVANAQYHWQDNTTDSLYLVTTSGTYSVTITNNCGSSTGKVNIDLHTDECFLYLPTGFSPNGDGKNDVFHAISHCPVDKFIMRVFNRWGEMLFESDDITMGWDGTFKQRPQPLDVYVYYLEYFNYCKGTMDKRSGNVTLLK